MFEAHQALALPMHRYFINAVLRHRLGATRTLAGLIPALQNSGDQTFLEQQCGFMIDHDCLTTDEADIDLLTVLETAREYIKNRRHYGDRGDGMEGEVAFPDVMAELAQPEPRHIYHRVLVTTEPAYLARWTSSPQMVSVQCHSNAASEANEARTRERWPER